MEFNAVPEDRDWDWKNEKLTFSPTRFQSNKVNLFYL